MYKPYNDQSATHQAIAKYILPYVMALLSLLIAGEIAGQFFTLGQLEKTSGTVANIHTQVVGHTRNRTTRSNRANYGLIITLATGSRFVVEDTIARTKLEPVIHIGDFVTIYQPSLFYKIVNTGFVKPIEQLELGNRVIYSFDDEKQGNYVIIGFLTVLLIVVYFWRRSWLKGDW